MIAEKIKKQLSLGLPGRKNESWKYLDVAPFFESYDVTKKFDEKELKQLFEKWKSENFFNGEYFLVFGADLLIASHLPQSIEIKKFNNEDSNDQQNVIEGVASILASQKYNLIIPSNTKLDRPLIIITMSTQITNSLYSKSLELNLGKMSEVDLVELSLNLSNNIEKQMSKLDIEIQDGAKLVHTKIKLDSAGPFSYSNTNISLGRDSSLKTILVTLDSKTNREELTIHLDQNGANAQAFGIYGVNSSESTDLNITMKHNASHTQSRQLYKGMISGDGHGIFSGKIDIKKDAQQVDSAQLSKNLLLTKRAHIHARPQLEVAADDVKAAHGATVGQLSDEESFYLESRGIPKVEAKLLLSQAFAYEVIEEISDSWARDYVSKNIKRPLLNLLEQKEN